MTAADIFSQIQRKQSFLCVGLDTDIKKIPKHLLKSDDPIFEFNKAIIDATKDLCVAYKPNIAFYEALGASGWESLRKTLEYIPKDIFTIADAKRGDIGNTSALYARAFFETLNFDSVTVAPYMGEDSVTPFLNFKNKWVILLAHTSNTGASDFQLFQSANGRMLYEEVMLKAMTWGNVDNLMFVVGATQASRVGHIRALAPDHFFLVPGVGAQGGDLASIAKSGMNKHCGLLVNSARAIIYASEGEDFAEAARREAITVRDEMKHHLSMLL